MKYSIRNEKLTIFLSKRKFHVISNQHKRCPLRDLGITVISHPLHRPMKSFTGTFTTNKVLVETAHQLLSLHKQSFSIALPETGCVVAYICNQISPIRGTQQQQKSINNCCDILKLFSKKFDTKLWHNFREILVKATLKI